MPLVYPRATRCPEGRTGGRPPDPLPVTNDKPNNCLLMSKCSGRNGGGTTLNVFPVLSSKLVQVSIPPLTLHLGRPAKVPGCGQKWVRNERSGNLRIYSLTMVNQVLVVRRRNSAFSEREREGMGAPGRDDGVCLSAG
jgi:hypothetical protein